MAQTKEEKRKKDRERSRKKRAKLEAAGICINCCTRPAAEGCKQCPPCLDKLRTRNAARKKRRRAAGRCAECEKPAVGDGVQCEEHARRRQVKGATGRARENNLPYDPDLKHTDLHWPCRCPYCDVLLDRGCVKTTPSIDRIIPDLGYVVPNLVVACNECNMRKKDATAEQLYYQADYLHELAKSRGLYEMAGPEVKIERACVKRTRDLGGALEKIAFRGRKGAPDRQLFGPKGMIFVEFKAPGCAPDPHQELVHREIRSWGVRVEVVDSVERFERLLRDVGL